MTCGRVFLCYILDMDTQTLDIRNHPSAVDLPDWANYIAMDQSGLIFVYQYNPVMHGSYWMGSRLKKICWAGMLWWQPNTKWWQTSKKPLKENIDPKYSGEGA